MTKSTTVEQVTHLPIEERLDAIAEIWDSIAAADIALPVSMELGEELSRRLARHAAAPETALGWPDMRNQA